MEDEPQRPVDAATVGAPVDGAQIDSSAVSSATDGGGLVEDEPRRPVDAPTVGAPVDGAQVDASAVGSATDGGGRCLVEDDDEPLRPVVATTVVAPVDEAQVFTLHCSSTTFAAFAHKFIAVAGRHVDDTAASPPLSLGPDGTDPRNRNCCRRHASAGLSSVPSPSCNPLATAAPPVANCCTTSVR